MDDEASIRALHAEHGGFLLRHALYLTAGNRHRAEELVHETIVRAWRQAAARTGKPPARPWLLTVARNLAAGDWQARPQRQADAPLSTEDATRILDSWAVADALAAMPPRDRRIIVETYYRGHPAAKAAAILGIPMDTVKLRTFCALKALKLALQDRGLGP